MSPTLSSSSPSRSLAGVSALALAALLASCGGGNNGQPTAPSSPDTGSASIRFSNQTAAAGLGFAHFRDELAMPIGCSPAVADYDNDDDIDIFVANSAGPSALFRNNGNGSFTDVAGSVGLVVSVPSAGGAGWADYDNDGDADLFVAAFGGSRLYRNDGPPAYTFTEVTRSAGVADPDATYRTNGVAWGDYDRDGNLDLLVARHLSENDPAAETVMDFTHTTRHLSLLRNNGDGSFSDATAALGDPFDYPSIIRGASFKPAFLDYDNDGDPDIYVVNDLGARNQPNLMLRNDGAGGRGGWTFTDVSQVTRSGLAMFGMGLAVGDYDNDGDLDLYITDIGDNELLRNENGGAFTRNQQAAGVGRGEVAGGDNVGWGTGFADFDNDGDLDLYAVAGYLDTDPVPASQPNALFVNRGDGTFSDQSAGCGADDAGTGRGLEIADFNADGRMDLFVCNLGDEAGSPGIAGVFNNVTASDGSWLALKLVGSVSNRDGVGARVEVMAGGVRRIREMGSSQSHMSHSVVPVHFGLGSATRADSVTIRWPSGQVQTLGDVEINRLMVVAEP